MTRFFDLAMVMCQYYDRLHKPSDATECVHFEPNGCDCRLCPGIAWWRDKPEGVASWPIVIARQPVHFKCEGCGRNPLFDDFPINDEGLREPLCRECSTGTSGTPEREG